VNGGGHFIVFEGGEGSGKSTAAEAVVAALEARDLRVVLTREPGGTVAGEKVRRLLHERLVPWAETYAFLTARAQLMDEVIMPALGTGAIVVCDRFEASTFAYQGWGRGLPLEALVEANARATNGRGADLTVWLDIDPQTGLARKHGEREVVATGAEALAFHRRVRDGYRALYKSAAPGSWLMLDATDPPEAVARKAIKAVENLLA
jgi:dTMP kinase